MQKDFGGVIWTNHAIARMRERGIDQGDAWATFMRSDTSKYAKTKKAYVYYKTWGATKIEVVAKQNEKMKWVILSVWSKPVKESIKRKNQKASLLTRLKNLF